MDKNDALAQQASAPAVAWHVHIIGCDGSADWVELGAKAPAEIPANAEALPMVYAQQTSVPSAEPVLWITRHRDDTPGARPTVHYSADEAARHLEQFSAGVARTVALVEASVPSAEPHPLTLLQAGFNNAELLAQWRKKLPSVEPTDRELSAFAVGTEVGWNRARDIERQDWNRVHHALAKHGKHPGRTDDHLADVIDFALAGATSLPATPPAAPVAPEPEAWCVIRADGVRLGPWWTREEAAEYVTEQHSLMPLYPPAASAPTAQPLTEESYAEGWKDGYKHGAWADAAPPAVPAPAVQPLSDAQIEALQGLDTPSRVRFYEHDFYVLSNFSAFRLEWEGEIFDTSEAAYHAEKFWGYGPAHANWDLIRTIREAPSAHEAFKIAEKNKALRRPDWDAVKVGIMKRILRAKADQHEYVRRKLLATGNRELVEDSWRDDFWGWGPDRNGQNMLGRLWMEVRAELAGITAAPTKE